MNMYIYSYNIYSYLPNVNLSNFKYSIINFENLEKIRKFNFFLNKKKNEKIIPLYLLIQLHPSSEPFQPNQEEARVITKSYNCQMVLCLCRRVDRVAFSQDHRSILQMHC